MQTRITRIYQNIVEYTETCKMIFRYIKTTELFKYAGIYTFIWICNVHQLYSIVESQTHANILHAYAGFVAEICKRKYAL